MRAFPPLALCLLLAAGPASAGNDFCDGGGKAADAGLAATPVDPAGGSCEIDMIVSSQPRADAGPYWRMRDLPFTQANVDVLKRSFEWPELPLELEEVRLPRGDASLRAASGPIEPPIGEPGGPYGESTFLEWSFRPSGPQSGARVLALTVRVDSRATYLRADWLAPASALWSYAGKIAPPPIVDSRTVRLYGNDDAPQRHLTLLHDGAYVRVGLGQPVQRWISFALPDDRWSPVRLRSGPLTGTPLGDGMGMKLRWPSLTAGTLNRDATGGGLPAPEPNPVVPRLD
ncbi:hypothetical protein J5226_04090 [Lysobacter sp. K5869]|uniref:hypothetical protein n=1 Tax=Lysobacter sp. K5869 TaxID=2820808 RepID=UPI001C063084|nr:hypothetical protein [Lysobacter sp. K5869]QWP77598.1 hypothetical protein J5226_04090 [Lysobacter sp. K5869]